MPSTLLCRALNDKHCKTQVRTGARAVIRPGEGLGIAVIAEGVETQGQRDFLHRNGCYAYQGYFFGKPIPAEDF
jgi:EAL domain-containing protein (putative c-di-GMP-specific phosphodiesterase class I)